MMRYAPLLPGLLPGLLPTLLCATAAEAALPPQYQNAKDLDVMVAYVRQKPRVMSSLRSLDLQAKIVYFDKDCQIVFGRASTPKPPGWAGPADPLEFKSSTCPVD